MKVIYQPRGRAKEFSPLAANLYRGCGHGCIYCYVPQTIKEKREIFATQPKPRKDVLKYLEKDAKNFRDDDREILLCFTSDPYQPLEMEDVQIPQIGTEDVLVKVRACGICHTDLKISSGEVAG